MTMRLGRFFSNIQGDAKLFIFLLLLVCAFRAYFIWYMSGFMGEGTESGEIGEALWTGMRLSLKTVGGITLISFVLATLPGTFFRGVPAEKIRLAIGSVASFLLSVLFQTRFPYYREFGTTFHLQIAQGLNDDLEAIFWTALQEYGMIWRFAVAVIVTIFSCWLLRRLLSSGTFGLPYFSRRWEERAFALMLAIFIGLFGLFVRFGGSFTYAKGINWENAGVTSDSFLNECILDDVQALYRTRAMAKRMRSGDIEGVRKDRVREYAKEIAGHGNLDSADLGAYLERTAKGAKLPKPKHIFVILGETYMQWPLMEEYSSIHVADGLKGIIEEENSYYSKAFLPNGDFTSIAITGLVTGLTEVNIRANYQPRTYEEVYPTAMAAPFHELGYKVDFWYGGIPSWDNINRMSIAQGFDNFYGYPDYHAPKQSAWGTKDGYLFDALFKHLSEESPTVHLLMTVTNHPPYNLDLEAEGFDTEKTLREVSKLPNVENPEELTRELGHYWYMDKVTADFARRVMKSYPDSLFVITGDHGVRCNPGTNPTLFEQQSVPFILYGNGVTKDILPKDSVGGHTSIVPTIVELIAPAGFKYRSIARSMTESPGIAFNRDCWITGDMMGTVTPGKTEPLPGAAPSDPQSAYSLLDRVMPPMRTLSWYLLEHGASLEEK